MNKFSNTVLELRNHVRKKELLKDKEKFLIWFKSRIKEMGISQRILSDDLNIDKTSVSLLISKKQKMTNRTVSAFYYYINYIEQYRINKEQRLIIKQQEKTIKELTKKLILQE